MTACLNDIAQFPDWPRGLSVHQAAAYVGVSVPTFLQEVEQGKWPRSDARGLKGTRRVWDRKALDEAYDRASELANSGPTEEQAIARLA